VIARKTIPLAKKLRDLALAGDRSMLRLWFQHVTPTRRGAPDWPALALVEDRRSCAVCRRRSPRPPKKARSRPGKPMRRCASSIP
jgi:hypothetical protein